MPRVDDLCTLLAPLAVTGSVAALTYTSVTHDSRQVTPGAVFVAVAGDRFDGHGYIAAAVDQGAVAVIGTAPAAELDIAAATAGTVPYIQVTDSRRGLAVAAAHLHGFPSRAFPVIGVTGTDGKTSTCSLLEAILAEATRTGADPAGRVGVITTVGARIRGEEQDTGFHVTTPDAPDVQRYLAAMRAAGCDYAVVESTSHGLHQARVAAVDFDVAAVTNITHEHLDYHGTRDAYVAAKALLFRALFQSPAKPGIPRVAVLNADDEGSVHALQAVLAEERAQRTVDVRTFTYGLAGRSTAPEAAGLPDVWADDVRYAPDSTRFTVHWTGGTFALTTSLIGEFNVYNILCAATGALALGIAPATIAAAVAAFPGVIGRMERIDVGQDFLAVVDFAHSPASLERALLTLRAVLARSDTDGRIIAVFGSAGLRDRAKRRLMGQVSGRLADFTVITAEDPRTEDLDAINREIAAGVLETAAPDRVTIVPDRAAAIQAAVDMARPGDVVAAFGKGHERSMCFGEIEYPWSDQDALRTALLRRQGKTVPS
ncbi:MAG: UDP-N-acetylmuramoyl-L-alanyl-D-glutamate--2,6-diaminopimelate ligase [Caldilineaceae bacterium]|nr:UDP-N-acetylmuramoyl-L-alanyl-D-glutamate--2,6-diaminopimelate ligase [Caldilineaceae bacterium]